MPYYDTLDEDLKRAKQILADGNKADLITASGTIYGKDAYAAYKLLESFVAEIERLRLPQHTHITWDDDGVRVVNGVRDVLPTSAPETCAFCGKTSLPGVVSDDMKTAVCFKCCAVLAYKRPRPARDLEKAPPPLPQPELRNDQHGHLDDVVIPNVALFRMERMDKDRWWMRCYLPSREDLIFHITTSGRSIDIEVETEKRDG